MRSDRTALANGHPVSPPHGSGPRTKLESLQAKCRHPALVIDTLSEAVSTFHRGVTSLKAAQLPRAGGLPAGGANGNGSGRLASRAA